ncbi:hypothetical protein IW262DRAFT_510049 [Armillaria fumosa]|nr:hypothetical protein IW262DRAFT_510049 [Armillaria fumosa]
MRSTARTFAWRMTTATPARSILSRKLRSSSSVRSSRRSLISRPGRMTLRMTGSTIGCIIVPPIGTSITRQCEVDDFFGSDVYYYWTFLCRTFSLLCTFAAAAMDFPLVILESCRHLERNVVKHDHPT